MHVDLMDVLSGYGASRFVGLGKMCDLLQIPSKSFLTKPIYEHILDGELEGSNPRGKRSDHIEPAPARDIDHIQRRLARYRTLELGGPGVENRTMGIRKRHRAESPPAPYPANLRGYVCPGIAAQ